MNQNPFVYNAPVRGKDFFNREETEKKILNETVTGKSQGNVWLLGERQVGKTSMLRWLQLRNDNDSKDKAELYDSNKEVDVVYIYTNCQNFKSPQDFYQNLHQSLKNFFDFKIENLEHPYQNFIHAIQYLYSKNYYLVFLLDEFDALIQYLVTSKTENVSAFLGELNKLTQGISEIPREAKAFSCVFSANYPIEELSKEIQMLGSGLIFEVLELSWFNQGQVGELADHYLQGGDIKLSKKYKDVCYQLSQGHPLLAQRLFSLFTDWTCGVGDYHL